MSSQIKGYLEQDLQCRKTLVPMELGFATFLVGIGAVDTLMFLKFLFVQELLFRSPKLFIDLNLRPSHFFPRV